MQRNKTVEVEDIVGHSSSTFTEKPTSTRCETRVLDAGWFWFDLLVVSVDWVLNIMEVATWPFGRWSQGIFLNVKRCETFIKFLNKTNRL